MTLPDTTQDIVLALIRLVVGVAFLISARNKFRDIPKFARNHDLPVFAGYFVASAELAGALGLFAGVLAIWAAAGLALLMVSTILLHVFKWRSSYWASDGGWEYDLMLFVLCAVIVLWGPGAFALSSLYA
jgi:putative oxidoreductase